MFTKSPIQAEILTFFWRGCEKTADNSPKHTILSEKKIYGRKD